MKKLISILLIIAMLFSMMLAAIPTSAEADVQPEAENITVAGKDTETGKLAAAAPAVPGDFDGNGSTDADAVAISDWATFRTVYSTGSHKGYLTKDLTLSYSDATGGWALTVVHTLQKDQAYLDGNGKTITFSSTTNNNGYTALGLFYNGGGTLTVKNLNLAGSVISKGEMGADLGLIIKRNLNRGAILENIVISTNITVNPTNSMLGGVGAAIGTSSSNTATLKNVHYTGTITVNGTVTANSTQGGYEDPSIGGLIGRSAAKSGAGDNSNATLTMTNCSNTGSIVSNAAITGVGVGGILGRADGKTTIENCTNSANIKLNGLCIDSGAAGIVGFIPNSANGECVVRSCTNNGNISLANIWDPTPQQTLGLGGIGGKIYSNLWITGSVNNGDITAGTLESSGVGGIVGSAHSKSSASYTVSAKGCTNTGTIRITYSGQCGVGGIMGQVIRDNTSYSLWVDVGATGDASTGNTNTGSITVKVRSSHTQNDGSGTTNTYDNRGVGGLVGYAYQASCLKVFYGKNSGNISLESSVNNVSRVLLGGLVGSAYAVPELRVRDGENTGDVSLANSSLSDSYDGKSTGGIVGGILGNSSAATLEITRCVNKGTLSAGGPIGGILGGTRAMSGTGAITLTITGCKNYGSVLPTNFSPWILPSGGIAGNISLKKIADSGAAGSASFTFTIDNCYNAGEVKGNLWTIGGILGQWDSADVDSTTASTVSNCVNAGSVSNTRTPTSESDSVFKTASGIVGQALHRSKINITGCLNVGSVATGDATNGYGAYPITNCVRIRTSPNADSTTFTHITASNNFYLADSISRTDTSNTWHKYSTSTNIATMKTKINALNTTYFDSTLRTKLNKWLGKNLADYIALDFVITSTEYNNTNISSKKFTDESKATFIKAYTRASNVCNNASASLIDLIKAKTNMQSAIAGLKAPDYSALNASINFVLAKINSGLTPDAKLQQAYNEAVALNSSGMSQNEIDTKTLVLYAAYDAFATDSAAYTSATYVNIDPTALENAIFSAEATEKGNHTDESWADFQTAIREARVVLDTYTTQAQVDAAITALNAAVEALVEAGDDNTGDNNGNNDNNDNVSAVDYTALQEAIAAVEALEESEYTESSWAQMWNALVQAKKALTSQNQAEVDAATENLNSKVSALEETTDADDSDNTTDDTSDETSNGKRKKKGCKSSIAAGAVIVTTVIALGAGVTFKKKED